MEVAALKTESQREKEAKDQEIYDEYHQLLAQPGAMKTAIDAHLCKKYNIKSHNTIWHIRRRVEKRQAALKKLTVK